MPPVIIAMELYVLCNVIISTGLIDYADSRVPSQPQYYYSTRNRDAYIT